MSPATMNCVSESETKELNFKDTELTLGLPGKSREIGGNFGTKRGFSETFELRIGNSSNERCKLKISGNDSSGESKLPASKAQVVGWPPVRTFRKNAMKSCKYVKVAVDGAPYLRKVDLEMYNSYQQLLVGIESMFSCFSLGSNYLNERKLMDPVNGFEFVPTYEDKDGDWMLLGDVPWKMFVESCKRLRLKKSFEATGQGSTTLAKSSSSTCY